MDISNLELLDYLDSSEEDIQNDEQVKKSDEIYSEIKSDCLESDMILENDKNSNEQKEVNTPDRKLNFEWKTTTPVKTNSIQMNMNSEGIIFC